MTKTLYIAVVVVLVAMSASDLASAREPVPVVVENSAAISADIARAQGLQQPFGVQLSCDFNLNTTCEARFPVPATSRLVIEFVTANCGAAPNSPFVATLTTTVGPNAATNYCLQPQDHTLSQVVSQLVKTYADPGTTVRFTAASQPQTAGCFVSMSGQEVSVP